MRTLTHSSFRSIFTGWAVFAGGLLLMSWLHTFRDRAAHVILLPLLLLLWVFLAASAWDGCKTVAPLLRYVLLAVQAMIALLASAWLIDHFIQNSP